MFAKILLLVMLTFVAAVPANALSTLDHEQLRAEIADRVDEAGIAGVAYAIVRNGEIQLVETIGEADLRSGEAITLETRFRIGELSKIPTALMLLRLLEQQQVSYQTEAANAVGLTNPFNSTAPLKLIHLLEQTSGLPSSSYSGLKNYRFDVNPSQLAQTEAKSWNILNPPGRHFVDSHLDFTLAAALAEQRTGTPFDVLMTDLLLNPLAMKGAGYTNELPIPYSSSYNAQSERSNPWGTGLRPSMGMFATIQDMALLTAYLASPDTAPALLEPEQYAALFKSDTAIAAASNFELHPGKGLYPFVSSGHMFWGGVGRIDGFYASIGVIPESGDGFVLLANTSKNVALRLIRENLSAYASQHLSLPSLPVIAAVNHSHHAGWWVPIGEKSALSRWLWDIGGHVYLASSNEGLQINQVLPGLDLRQMAAIDENSYRPLRSDKAVLQFFTFQGEKFLISSTLEVYRSLSTAAVLPYFALFGLALYALGLGALVGIFALPMTLARAVKNKVLITSQALLGSSAICCISAILLFLRHDFSDEFALKYALSTINGITLTLAALSMLWPLLTLIAIVVLCIYWRQFSARSLSWVSTTAIGQLILIVYLASYNWVPLLTWQH